MSTIRKADFYYGSLLSVLVNNEVAPAIVHPSDDPRRIYSVTTNNGDFEIYSKYVTEPGDRQKNNSKLWNFNFSKEEVQSINQYKSEDKTVLFALLCGQHHKLQDSEIAVLTLEQAKDCLDSAYLRENHRIAVKTEHNKPDLRVYGTGRSDENRIRIKRFDFSLLKREEPSTVNK
ncbi:hypothetical protein [Salibacterium halotolerans]|uniref:Uncharacterized protein n=1 Tax=Salibacterium halotolerans TaxID=1884432 RepID=A0A1I5PSR1_9BACI|nr:hypothetical protein [Salibacterium halotolerans]SFP36910.1 hypothetical protein SAMN05518683_104212 [Salibacterium halotolerans]